MARVALITYDKLPDLADDDRLLAEALMRRGVKVDAVVWTAPDAGWSMYDLIIVRSTWDYHLKPDAYREWIRGFLRYPGRLWNPPAALLANINKSYLLDLSARGVTVVPTVYVEAGDEVGLQAVLEREHWDEVVIKPAISASSEGVWRSAQATVREDQATFRAQLRHQDLLVQPYFREVAEQGEWSLVFFNGAYSHAVLKKPIGGDYRTHGGREEAAVPEAGLIEQAAAIFSRVETPLLYTRVDGVEREGRFFLMEWEINEPFLFLASDANATDRFAEAVLNRLRGAPPSPAADTQRALEI